ncbi:MAG TPA: MFS transporter [Jatrophihabitans sp.]|nr:MFS transporter [Jatrophihabitans sp.]
MTVETDPADRSIFAASYRVTTVGVLMLMTIIAFEALAVATALPTAARSLHGLAAYGWAFTGFLITSVIGMVVSGLRTDRRGPRLPLLAGLGLFVAGLVVASLAGSMWLLVLARVVQGLAVGLLITAMYVVMGEVYPSTLRPRMLAALATAWILPGLVGPIVAGWITEQLSWRWVFGGLAPFAAAGGLLLLPALRRLRNDRRQGGGDPRRVWFAVLTAAGIAGVAEIGQQQNAASLLLAVAGLAAMLYGLRRLLPPGTAGFQAGVPAAIAFRGVLAGAFVGMEVLVPLTLSVQRHYPPTLTGLPLMLTAITWAGASQLQGRSAAVPRATFVRLGLALIAVAGVGMALVAARLVPGWGAFVVWPVAGAGAGFALTTVSAALMEFTTDADRGSDSSSLQLADSSLSAVTAAYSGALVSLAAHGRLSYGTGLAVAFLTMAVLAGLAVTRAGQLRPGPRPVPRAGGPRSGQRSRQPAGASPGSVS